MHILVYFAIILSKVIVVISYTYTGFMEKKFNCCLF